MRALFRVRLPDGFALEMSRTFDRTVEIKSSVGRRTVTAHFQPSRADGDAIGVDQLSGARSERDSVSRVEDDDRFDLFCEEIVVVAAPVVAGIVDGSGDRNRETVFQAGFDQPVETAD